MTRNYPTKTQSKARPGARRAGRSGARQQRQAHPQAAQEPAAQEHRLELPGIQLPLDRTELIQMAQNSLHTFAVELGLKIAGHLLEDEVVRLCGPRYQRQADREHTRYGHQPGVVTLSGQKLRINRPRVRKAGGGTEADLETYRTL